MNAADRSLVLEIERDAVHTATWAMSDWNALTPAQHEGIVRLATDPRLQPVDVDERFDALFSEAALAEADERGLWDYLREWIRLAAAARAAVNDWQTADLPRLWETLNRLNAVQACFDQALRETVPVGSDA